MKQILRFFTSAVSLFCSLFCAAQTQQTVELTLPRQENLPWRHASFLREQQIGRSEDGSLIFGQDSFIQSVLAVKPDDWDLSFSFRPQSQDFPEGESHRISPIVTLRDLGSSATVILVEYPGRQEQLLCCTINLEGKKYCAVQARRNFPADQWTTVEIASREGKLTLSVNGEIVQSETYAGTPLPVRKMIIGSTGNNGLVMQLRQLRFSAARIPVTAFRQTADPPDESEWEVRCHGNAKVSLTKRDDGLLIDYDGGDGTAEIIWKKEVFLAEEQNHIHFTGTYTTLHQEYGSNIEWTLNTIREPRAMSMSGDKSFPLGFQCHPTGERDRVDYSVPAYPDTGYRLRIVLDGNPSAILLHTLDVRSEKIVRDPRPPVNAENRSYDRAAVEASLAKISPCRAAVNIREGAAELLLDGKPVFPAMYRRGLNYPQWSRYAAFRDEGFKLFTFYATFNKPPTIHRDAIGNLWQGLNTYDFSGIAEELRIIHSIAPDARVLLSVCVEAYPTWDKDFPQATMTNAKGELGYGCYGTTFKTVWYGKDVEPAREKYGDDIAPAPSLYSEEFRREASRAMEALARFLETDPAGKIVLGIHVTGGADGQYFPLDREVTSGEDHSPSAVRAWSEWLTRKYRTDEALRAAWEDPQASLAQPGVPTPHERGWDNTGVPSTQQGVDFTSFINDSLAELRLALFAAVKRGSNGRLITGAYAPAGYAGNCRVDTLLDSPDTDFLVTILRNSPTGSYLLHKKLHLAEEDLRSPHSMAPIGNYLFDEEYFRCVALEATALSLQRLAGAYYLFDIGECYYHDAPIHGYLGGNMRMLQSVYSPEDTPPIQAGVFIDIDQFAGLPFRDASKLRRVAEQETCCALEHSGIPFRVFSARDVFHPDLELPKLVVFPLQPGFTEEQVAKLREKARKSGTLIIWGYPLLRRPVEALERCGFRLQFRDDLPNRQPRLVDGGKLLGRRYRAMGSSWFQWQEGMPASIVPEPGDTVLATYGENGPAAIVLRDRNGAKEIFNGAPGAYSPALLRRLAGLCGAAYFSDDDSQVVSAANGFVSVLCERGGEHTFRIPDGMEITSTPTAHTFQIKDGRLTFHSKMDGETAIFQLRKVK